MRPTRIAAALLASLLAACGGDGASETSGTCDFTAVETRRTCLEQSGPSPEIADQRAACVEHAGAWTSAACPENDELIGCCLYELGLRFRECFYTYPERSYDPQAVCTSATFNGVPGVWQPAP
jgi:hypothetical protein